MDIRNLFISMNGTIKVKQISKDNFKVFHNNTKALGIINHDGKKLLELCNGKRRIKEIVDEIGRTYVNDKKEIEEMVVSGLKHFKWINMVTASSNEIAEEYDYRVFSSGFSADHIIFDISKIIIRNNGLENSIRNLAEKGVFQITLICNGNIDIDTISNIVDVCKNCKIITNIFFNSVALSKSKVEDIGKMINGKMTFEFINYSYENIINLVDEKHEVINIIRAIRELQVPVNIQIRTNNVGYFEEMIKLCSFLDTEKVYYDYTNISFKDEFERRLDNTETQLLGQCHKIPEIISGNWYDCRENEIISLSDDLNMEVGICEN